MNFQFVFLTTDYVVCALLLFLAAYGIYSLRRKELRAKWAGVLSKPSAAAAATVLLLFIAVAALDSVHFRSYLGGNGASDAPVLDVRTESLLDRLVPENARLMEKSYSAPFSVTTFEKISRMEGGKSVRDFEPLQHAGSHLKDRSQHAADVRSKAAAGLAKGAGASLFLWAAVWGLFRKFSGAGAKFTASPLFCAAATLTVFTVLFFLVRDLWPYYHVLGTNQTGGDILYEALKSHRTALVIGSLATLSMLPFAVMLGISAGFFMGKVDDAIQYIYTTLSSIPSVLLIAASVLMIQVYIDSHPGLYETALERADIKLFTLALIIGVTGWSSLARLLRAETMKLSQMEYVQAARAMGVSAFGIMRRHIFPNVLHIVLIVAVLDFSGIVLYEAVLSYVGVGVDPTTFSFGTMINTGRLELSRDPVIWWNLAAAFFFMLLLVLAANLFASSVREAFDPRANTGRRS
jgi:peptide/nickel transport system permease protein